MLYFCIKIREILWMKEDRKTEFKYLEIPNGEELLALLGSSNIREYGIYKDGRKTEYLHFHNLMEIAICRWGKGEVNLNHKWYPYSDGDIIVIPKNYPHSINSYGKNSFWEYVYIKPSDFLNKISKEHNLIKRHYLEEIECRPFIKDKSKVADLESEINLLMNQTRVQAYGYRECIKAILLALLMEIRKINHIDQDIQEVKGRQSPQKVKTLSLAMEYIETNYQKELRISDIANAACVSETALRRLFVECCEMSPMQYVKKVRIDEACKMMRKADVNINEIALIVGFKNTSPFITNFKKMQGCTPKQWEHQHVQKPSDDPKKRNK